ncbi:hypothetical protein [Paenibacillus sp. D2_2]|uniref:hypothetical protein n=1 Tax=Paenibacillus sp. D2_2 TaxID=3073092 RepID=UPI0035BF92E4
MPRLLSAHGDELAVMSAVGVYNRGIPLVQLVTMLASSLSVLFIPVLAEMNVRGYYGDQAAADIGAPLVLADRSCLLGRDRSTSRTDQCHAVSGWNR